MRAKRKREGAQRKADYAQGGGRERMEGGPAGRDIEDGRKRESAKKEKERESVRKEKERESARKEAFTSRTHAVGHVHL